MTPLRCGLNSCPSYTIALRNLPQFANFLLGSAPCCLDNALFGFTRSTLDCGHHHPSCGLGATVGWVWGAKIFSGCFCRRGEEVLMA